MSAADATARAAQLLTAGDRAGAVRAYRLAAQLDRGLFGQLAMARALIVAGEPVERPLRRTLASYPDSAAAAGMLGTALAEAGQIDAAREFFARAIARDDAQVAYHYDLARSTKGDADQRHEIETALKRSDLSAMQRVALQLAAGKIADDLDDRKGAAAAWLAAAEVGEAAVPYDRERQKALTDAVIATFDAATIATLRSAAPTTALPLLIVGLPRSGTTLVETLLGNHPAIVPGGEREDLMRACADAPLPPGLDDATSLASRIRGTWLKNLRSLSRPSTRHVTDKLPHNYVWLGWVAALLPNVRIVHVRRDPRDVALSIMGTYFGRSPAFPALPRDIGAHIHDHDRLMAHWRGVLPADRLYQVDYEALVGAPEDTMRDLLSWLELPWHINCAGTASVRGAIRSASKYQARRPVDRGSVARWRRYADLIPLLGELQGA